MFMTCEEAIKNIIDRLAMQGTGIYRLIENDQDHYIQLCEKPARIDYDWRLPFLE